MKGIVQQLRSIFTTAEPVDKSPYADFNKTRQSADRSKICHAPFKTIRFEQRGVARTCCFNREVVLGRYPEMTLTEIWNSEEANALRERVARNELGYGCQRCEKQLINKEYDTVKLKQYDGLPDSDSGYPTMLDFSIHNTCNLECVMCHGEFSSSIRKNREGLPPVPMVYDAQFVKQLEEFIPHAKQFVFAGGEPFLIDLYYDIWESINRLNPTDVHIVTNGTIMNNRVKGILENGRYHITHSIESLNKDNYEAIRKNAGLDKVLENMKYFMDYCKKTGTEYAINICPLQQNWKEIPEFVSYCNEHGIKLYILTVIFPPTASLMSLPAAKLEEIDSYYSKFEFDSNDLIRSHNASNFQDLIMRVRGWKKLAYQKETQRDEPKDDLVEEDSLDISVLFDMVIDKIDSFEQENPEVDSAQIEAARKRILKFNSVYQNKRITQGKFKEMDNVTADVMVGAISGSSDEDFGLIIRDHIMD